MVVLKKIKSATLIEALVATVLIVIIFVIASLTLNNLILNTFSKNTHAIENRVNELKYEFQNEIIAIPYREMYHEWEINASFEKIGLQKLIVISATKHGTNKEIIKHQVVWDQEN